MPDEERQRSAAHAARVEAVQTGRLLSPLLEEPGRAWNAERQRLLVNWILEAETAFDLRETVADLRAMRALWQEIEQLVEAGKLAAEFLAKQERAS